MICRTAKYGARLSMIAENQVVTLSRHLATFKGLEARTKAGSAALTEGTRQNHTVMEIVKRSRCTNTVGT